MAFAAGELERRRALRYPPYSHLIRVICWAEQSAPARDAAFDLRERLLEGLGAPGRRRNPSARPSLAVQVARARAPGAVVKASERRPAVGQRGRPCGRRRAAGNIWGELQRGRRSAVALASFRRSDMRGVRMDPRNVRVRMSGLCALAPVLAISLTVMSSVAMAAPKRISYARLTHACPPPPAGSATCFAVVREPIAASASASASAAPAGSGVYPYAAGAGSASAGPAGGLTPGELATAYGYSPAGGSGQTVAIIDA